MKKVATRALAALALLACSLAAFAQPSNVENDVRAAMQAAAKVARVGPQDVKLVDQALLKVPEGLVYIPPAEAGRLLAAMGNRAGDNLLGLDPAPSSPEEMAGFLAREQERYAQIIKAANVHLE